MVLVSLWKPAAEQVQRLLSEISGSVPFNYAIVGATQHAQSPEQLQLQLAREEGTGWIVDHRRVKIGNGRRQYQAAKKLLQKWGQFQLEWAQVSPSTGTDPGSPVAVAARSLFLWTVNPLRVVYSGEKHAGCACRPPLLGLLGTLLPGSARESTAQRPSAGLEPSLGLSFSQSMTLMTSSLRHTLTAPPQIASAAVAGPRQGGAGTGQAGQRSRRARRTTQWQLGHGCVQGHLLAGEESFRIEWDHEDDSVWYEILTFSRPVHPLSIMTYPLVRFYQARFAADSANLMAAALKSSL